MPILGRTFLAAAAFANCALDFAFRGSSPLRLVGSLAEGLLKILACLITFAAAFLCAVNLGLPLPVLALSDIPVRALTLRGMEDGFFSLAITSDFLKTSIKMGLGPAQP